MNIVQVHQVALAPVVHKPQCRCRPLSLKARCSQAPARPMRPPSRARHCTVRICATALSSLPRAPWPTRIARLSSSRGRARCATPAPVLPNMESVLILLYFCFPRGNLTKSCPKRDEDHVHVHFMYPPQGTFQIRQQVPASQKAASLGSTG